MKNRPSMQPWCLFTLFLSAVFVFGAQARVSADDDAQLNTLTAKQQEDGWKKLFDGKSLDGWEIRSGFATYKVEDGAIVGTTASDSPNTFLVTKKPYGDFDLKFQVKLDDNALNSGVQIRSKLRGDEYGGRVHGPQAEIEASPGQSGYIYGEALGTGWLSPSAEGKNQPPTHSHFKNQQWNDYRIRAVGGHIQTWINGHAVADLKLPDEVAKNHAQGLIGLQVHGVGDRGPFQVRWRNLYLKELNP